MGSGAGEESRTLDLLLGKQTLYQLSYSRSSGHGSKPTGRGVGRLSEWAMQSRSAAELPRQVPLRCYRTGRTTKLRESKYANRLGMAFWILAI